MKNWYLNLKDNKIFSNILCFVVALPGLFLLTNKYPLVAIISISTVLFLGIFFLFYKRYINTEHYIVLGVLSILYFYFILSYFISGQSLKNFFTYEFLRYDGSFFFGYILFFALAVPFFNYRKAANIYFKIIFFTFSAFALFALIMFLSKNFSILYRLQNREESFIVFNLTHNATGSVYALVSVFLLAFFLWERNKKFKIAYIIMLAVCIVGLFLTRSRGSYISFIAGSIIVLWIYFRSVKKFLIALLAMIAALVPVIFISGAYKRVLQIFDFKEVNISWRMVLFERAMFMFKQSPIFGIGFGRFNDISSPDIINNFNFNNMHIFLGYPKIISFIMERNFVFSDAHAHNSYAHFLAETGIIGLGLIILFWILCFKSIYRGYSNTVDELAKKIFLSAMGGIIALFTISITENYFASPTILMCISMVTSLSLGLCWQERKKILQKDDF
jgi:O-antigen ligase